MARIGGEVGSY